MLTKDYLYYYQMSIKEGLDIETEKLHLEMCIDKTVSRKCSEGTVLNFL